MNMATTIKFKKLNEKAILPSFANEGDAGLDICSTQEVLLMPGQRALVKTGLAIQLPKGWEAQVRSRSGLAYKHGVVVLNSPGTIDEPYRGEIGVILINHGQEPYSISIGDRIAQLVLKRTEDVVPVFVEELNESNRGSGGFGSTGY